MPVNNESSGSGGEAPGINLSLAHADHVDHENTLAASGQPAAPSGTLQLPEINPVLNQQQFAPGKVMPAGSSATGEGLTGQLAHVGEDMIAPAGQTYLNQPVSDAGQAALAPIEKAFANFTTNPQTSLGGTISQGLGDLGHLFTGNLGGSGTPQDPSTNQGTGPFPSTPGEMSQ